MNNIYPQIPDYYLTIPEAAEVIGVAKPTIRRWIRKGLLPSYGRKGTIRVKLSELLPPAPSDVRTLFRHSKNPTPPNGLPGYQRILRSRKLYKLLAEIQKLKEQLNIPLDINLQPQPTQPTQPAQLNPQLDQLNHQSAQPNPSNPSPPAVQPIP